MRCTVCQKRLMSYSEKRHLCCRGCYLPPDPPAKPEKPKPKKKRKRKDKPNGEA